MTEPRRGELRAVACQSPRTSILEEPDNTEDLWDVKRCAQYLRVSPSWVYQRADSGELPVCKVGGLKRFAPSIVRAFARGEVVGQTRLALGRDTEGQE